jgi:hypothetical protein
MWEAAAIQKGPLQNSGVCRRMEEYKRGRFKTVVYVGGRRNTKGAASKQWHMQEAGRIQKGPLHNSGVCGRQQQYKRGRFKTVAYAGGRRNTKGAASK